MLKGMDNWGTFLFFAGGCFVSLFYVFVGVPETSGLSLENIDKLFEGPFWQMGQRARRSKTLFDEKDSESTVERGTSAKNEKIIELGTIKV
jgi:hypothetical protein